MKSRTALYILSLVIVALFTWGIATSTRGGDTGDATPATASEVLAIVGGEEITRNEVETTAGPQLFQLRSQIYDLTDQALKQTIDGRILDLDAENRGVDRD